jgi:gliding motility-associated-like protein
MPNGFNLGSHWSTSYSALIVPNPSNDNQYYIFSVDGHPTSNGTGIFHSIVDMTLNNGLGDVLVAGKRTLLLSNTSELMQGAYHSNGTDFWVIIPDYPEDTNDVMKLYAYQVSGTGVSAPVITSLVGTGVDFFNPFVFKITPNNQKAILTALSFNERRSVLLDFNNLTGSFTFNTTFAIYNPFTSQGDDLRRGGFSPDGSIYYVEKSVVTTVWPFFGTRLFQYEMNGLNINSIPIQIGNTTNILDIKDGPDGKLYVNMDSANPTFLSRIENPNVLGVGCNFTLNSISLANRRISIALPLFLKPNHNYIIPTASIAITSNPNPATICLGQPIVFTANTNFVGTPQLQWQVNGINVLGQTGLIFTSSSLTNGDIVTCSLTDTCSVINSNSITVSTVIVPTFTQVQPICIGEALGNLPTTSNNGILGSWTPALNNNQTTTYTFTPNLGQCSSTATMTIQVNPLITPTFTQVQPICIGEALGNLPTTSNNGILGSWTPALNNTQTTTYTFTPNLGQCSSTATMTIQVNPLITPTFTQVQPICVGEALANLPTTSNNGILGSWSPALNNNQTTTYTFTPNLGQCSSTATMTIQVNPLITPTFIQVQPICVGEALANLPTTSNNGILGSWSPALNAIQTTTYTFTPNLGQCSSTATMTIEVNNNFNFSIKEYCNNSNLLLEVLDNDLFDLNNSFISWYVNNLYTNQTDKMFNLTNYLNSTSPVPVLPILVSAEVVNEDGCTKKVDYLIENLYCGIQKGISPNNDGSNEFFDLRLLSVKKLSIFNRHGVLAFEKENYYNEWVGQTNKGAELPDGTYYYLINFKNDQPSKTGWIYINR